MHLTSFLNCSTHPPPSPPSPPSIQTTYHHPPPSSATRNVASHPPSRFSAAAQAEIQFGRSSPDLHLCKAAIYRALRRHKEALAQLGEVRLTLLQHQEVPSPALTEPRCVSPNEAAGAAACAAAPPVAGVATGAAERPRAAAAAASAPTTRGTGGATRPEAKTLAHSVLPGIETPGWEVDPAGEMAAVGQRTRQLLRLHGLAGRINHEFRQLEMAVLECAVHRPLLSSVFCCELSINMAVFGRIVLICCHVWRPVTNLCRTCLHQSAGTTRLFASVPPNERQRTCVRRRCTVSAAGRRQRQMCALCLQPSPTRSARMTRRLHRHCTPRGWPCRCTPRLRILDERYSERGGGRKSGLGWGRCLSDTPSSPRGGVLRDIHGHVHPVGLQCCLRYSPQHIWLGTDAVQMCLLI